MAFTNFEWDERKNKINLLKHGYDFSIGIIALNDPQAITSDARQDYGELRQITIGRVAEEVFIVVVHTDRNGVTRIISVRPANKKERRKYYDYNQDDF
ncbi:toxin BrnT [Candidatus Termititenax aidoneus]|uniref:Toxin BrnT n=1 Tax=Termititenax aidoneus TaxID=2218524 RepID=A0A388TC87_TERA1|nr:toxin BrnT [Candidatus Termititenax aidoneus]